MKPLQPQLYVSINDLRSTLSTLICQVYKLFIFATIISSKKDDYHPVQSVSLCVCSIMTVLTSRLAEMFKSFS